MRKKTGARTAALCMAAVLATTGNGINVQAAGNINTNGQSDNASSANVTVVNTDGENISSPVLITEVVPNTRNADTKGDVYEYYELTNISGHDINLDYYDIVYVNGNKPTVWKANLNTIPAGQTMLVWVKNEYNQELTKADFCKEWNVSEDGLLAEVQCSGMSNSGSRSLAVATKTGKILSTATYNAANSSDGKLDENEAVGFQYNGDSVTVLYDQTATPFEPDAINGTYTASAVVETPEVQVTSVTRVNENESLDIQVENTNLDMDNIVSAIINVDGVGSYAMAYGENGVLTGTIPGNAVSGLESFSYSVSITDGVNTATSGTQTVKVLASTVDQTKAPSLVITEILPDSANVDGSDAYEFIELYNNSNQDINLKDYKLYYHYTDTGSDTIWWETDEDTILETGKTLIFWVKNSKNGALTLEDFNNKFGTSLSDKQLIEITCDGMANGSARGIRFCSNVKDDIDLVTYNDAGADDTTVDKSITYQNQYVDGMYTSVMTANNAAPTPGKITDGEKPDYQAELTTPESAPAVEDLTTATFDNETQSLAFDLTADSAETTIKTVKLHIKYNEEENYEIYNLLRTNENHFTKLLNNVDLLNKQSFTYYFTVSDGYQTVETEVRTITNTGDSQNSGFSLSDGEMIAGSRQVIAYGEQLQIDGNDVSGEASKSLNGVGKLAFDTTQTDVFFKNAVSVGDKVVGIFNEGTYDQWRTYVYDVDAELFDYGNKTVTVQFHAGNKANVLEHNIENNDDFVLKNIRMVLPSGKTLYPSNYQAKYGLGVVEHDNMDDVEAKDVTIASQEKEIQMGDGTSKYEILYATFSLSEEDFSAVRYLWDTTTTEDGAHRVSNGTDEITVNVDNTAPEITTNIEDGQEYHSGTIEVNAADAFSQEVRTTVLLDGKNITVPYDFRSLEMRAGEHTLYISASDQMGNTSAKEVKFTTPKESADIDTNILPENGTVVNGDPTLSIKATDPSGDTMSVAFKTGERYQLGDMNITSETGASSKSGTIGQDYDAASGNGFPYETFNIAVDDTVNENAVINVKWSGTSNNRKTFLYVYNTVTGGWDKLDAEQTIDGENMTLQGEVVLTNHLVDANVKVLVQNGEGYTPAQYDTVLEGNNQNDTPRAEYDFTLAVESDTQYYNEAYEGNPDQVVDGKYQYQLDIHNWTIANRERMNIQYMFHDGDIIDDEPNRQEWLQADAAYQLLDQAGFPYGVLAGNHDVGHLSGDYTNFSQYFGESRYNLNPWYGASYQNNRGHYDLITVDGIDFIMIYMGWGIGDEEINWMNEVLAQYPERKAILNFHEYLLASGGMGEEPQRVHDEVVAVNDNVCMVLSGHYHNAYTRIDTFTKADGTERQVYNMLFDYQGLPEGGLGYMRLMHFDLANGRVIVRTYSPSLNDYDAKETAEDLKNDGNSYFVESASINGEEDFEVSFEALGIVPQTKILTTTDLDVNVYGDELIGQVDDVESGSEAQYTWTGAPDGVNGWYAEVTDANGGISRTGVQYLTVERDTIAPALTVPGETEIAVGDTFDPMTGVSAVDDKDGDLTTNVIVTGSVDTGKVGNYEITYSVSDAAGNKTEATRVINVKEKVGGDITPDGTTTPGGTDTSGKGTAVGGTNVGTNQTAKSVKTGDTANTGICWASGILAAVAAVVSALKLKKKKDK